MFTTPKCATNFMQPTAEASSLLSHAAGKQISPAEQSAIESRAGIWQNNIKDKGREREGESCLCIKISGVRWRENKHLTKRVSS